MTSSGDSKNIKTWKGQGFCPCIMQGELRKGEVCNLPISIKEGQKNEGLCFVHKSSAIKVRVDDEKGLWEKYPIRECRNYGDECYNYVTFKNSTYGRCSECQNILVDGSFLSWDHELDRTYYLKWLKDGANVDDEKMLWRQRTIRKCRGYWGKCDKNVTLANSYRGRCPDCDAFFSADEPYTQDDWNPELYEEVDREDYMNWLKT